MIAIESKEAVSKAFYDAFGINPGKYRKSKQPIPLVFKKDVLFPDNLRKEGDIIKVNNKEILVKLVEVPAHKLFYIKREGVSNYIDFWNLVDAEEGMDCDYLHGVLASIKGLYSEGFGAFTEDGYLFGKDAPLTYELEGDYPFEEVVIPAQKYLQFEHPGFTEAEFEVALKQVRQLALHDFDYRLEGYEIDHSFVKAYEHSGMELCFYFIRIPIKSTR